MTIKEISSKSKAKEKKGNSMTLKDKVLVMIGDKVSLTLIILVTLTMEELVDAGTQIYHMVDTTDAIP